MGFNKQRFVLSPAEQTSFLFFIFYFLFSDFDFPDIVNTGPKGAVYTVWIFICICMSLRAVLYYGNKILYKDLDLTQDFPNKISFHFLWVKMLPKNLPKIFRWPEMCPLDKILAQDFQMAAFTKILGRRDTSVVPLLSTENCKTLF